MQPPSPTTIPATEAPTDLSRARLAIVVGNQIMSVPADGIGASFGFQPADPALTSFSGVSWVAGDMLYFSGTDTAARLAKGTASQQLRMNAGATAPEWFTPAGLDAALTSIAGVSWVAGDLGYWSGTDTAARLAKGTAGQVLQMNAGATAPQWATPVGLIKAWVNFNGTGTPAISASLNVSSITDNGTGDYTINFTAALTDANFACSVATYGNLGGANDYRAHGSPKAFTSSSVRIQCGRADEASSAVIDPVAVHVIVMR